MYIFDLSLSESTNVAPMTTCFPGLDWTDMEFFIILVRGTQLRGDPLAGVDPFTLSLRRHMG